MKTELRDRREIASLLVTNRQMNNMTQDELAKQLGVSRMIVRCFEVGSLMPDDKEKVALANILGLSVMDLFFKEEE